MEKGYIFFFFLGGEGVPHPAWSPQNLGIKKTNNNNNNNTQKIYKKLQMWFMPFL